MLSNAMKYLLIILSTLIFTISSAFALYTDYRFIPTTDDGGGDTGYYTAWHFVMPQNGTITGIYAPAWDASANHIKYAVYSSSPDFKAYDLISGSNGIITINKTVIPTDYTGFCYSAISNVSLIGGTTYCITIAIESSNTHMGESGSGGGSGTTNMGYSDVNTTYANFPPNHINDVYTLATSLIFSYPFYLEYTISSGTVVIYPVKIDGNCKIDGNATLK